MRYLAKAAAMMLCISAVLSMDSCTTRKPANQKDDTSAKGEASIWFDSDDPEHQPDRTDAFGHSMVPETLFNISNDCCTITVTHYDTTYDIYGMPFKSAYFTDLTGDDIPELCCVLYYGSGIIDSRIMVLDTTTSKTYELSAREKFDYDLKIERKKLRVIKRPYSTDGSSSETETGSLAILGDKLLFTST